MKKKTQSEIYAYAISPDRVLVSKAFVVAAETLYSYLGVVMTFPNIVQHYGMLTVQEIAEIRKAFDAAKKG